MKTLGIVVIGFAVLYLLILLFTFYKSGRFLKVMFITALSGLIPLFVLNLLSSYIGIAISINAWTLGISASFGLPGIIAMLTAVFFF